MNRKRLGLIHTSATLVSIFAQLCKEKVPNVETFNIVDDSLVKGILDAGSITDEIRRRVASYIRCAELAGADFILVTCSSIGPAVEAAASEAAVPVLRVDQPMADQAVAEHDRIGVIATLRSTLEPTANLIQRRAAHAGKAVELTSTVAEGAFDALMSGDASKHDAMVVEALKRLARQVDVIVLAQASMARVVDALAPEEKRVPILASPGIAVNHLATVL